MTAGEMVERFAEMMSQPAISKHLSVLENAGLVRREKREQSVHYGLKEDALTGTLAHFLAGLAPSHAGLGQGERYDPRQGQDRRSQSARMRVWRPGPGSRRASRLDDRQTIKQRPLMPLTGRSDRRADGRQPSFSPTGSRRPCRPYRPAYVGLPPAL
jgi:DNA-binding transcriptional ArsR family regulator